MKSKILLSVFAVSAALAAETVVPHVVSITKAGKVASSSIDVTYTLDAPAVVTYDIRTNGVPMDAAFVGSAKGDVFKKVDAGVHSFSLRVVGVLPEETSVTDGGAVVRVKAWPTNAPPDYMVIDLSRPNGDMAYYEEAGQIPGGVTADRYKTTHLVMRKMPAAHLWWLAGNHASTTSGSFDTPHWTMLTSDYYLGVYELTNSQKNRLYGETPSTSKYPVRGSYNAFETILSASCAYGGLQFRMPTVAEWEFACRAGSTNALYTGEELLGTSESSNLDAIAWYGYNSGSPAGDTASVSMHEVGLKDPNAWGLYDMLGNVWEWCSDWMTSYTFADQIDPVGGTHTQRTRCGGAYDSKAECCTAYKRIVNNPTFGNDSQTGVNGTCNNNQGLRLCLPCSAVR